MTFDLTKPEDIKELHNQADEAVFYDDISLAIKVKLAVKKAMQEQAGFLSDNPALAQSLATLILDMEFIQFASLPDAKCAELMQNHLLDSFSIIDYDLSEKIRKRMDFTDLIEDQVAFARQTMDNFKQCNQLLGKKNIVILQRQAKPSVRNWLQDYESFPSQNARKENLDELNYVNKSTNVTLLSKEERQRLLQIIKIYDSLKNVIVDYESLPTSDIPDPSVNVDSLPVSAILPGVIEDLPERKVPAPGVGALKPLQEVAVPAVLPSVPIQRASAPAFPAAAKSLVSAPGQLPPKAVNIQDILKQGGRESGGLKPPEVKAKPAAKVVPDLAAQAMAAQEKRKMQEHNIDVKLEELKKKLGE